MANNIYPLHHVLLGEMCSYELCVGQYFFANFFKERERRSRRGSENLCFQWSVHGDGAKIRWPRDDMIGNESGTLRMRGGIGLQVAQQGIPSPPHTSPGGGGGIEGFWALPQAEKSML